jgi:hypothetical protein
MSSGYVNLISLAQSNPIAFQKFEIYDPEIAEYLKLVEIQLSSQTGYASLSATATLILIARCLKNITIQLPLNYQRHEYAVKEMSLLSLDQVVRLIYIDTFIRDFKFQ